MAVRYGVVVSRNQADAKRVATRYDLTDPTTYYIGYADYVGTQAVQIAPSESATVWTIKKITLVSGSPTSTKWSPAGAASWTNRTTEAYE